MVIISGYEKKLCTVPCVRAVVYLLHSLPCVRDVVYLLHSLPCVRDVVYCYIACHVLEMSFICYIACHVLEMSFICYIACPQAVSDQEKTGHKGAQKPLHPELVSNEDQQHNKVRL